MLIINRKAKYGLYFNVVIWLSHGSLLRGLTRLCALCKVFLELKALKDPIC